MRSRTSRLRPQFQISRRILKDWLAVTGAPLSMMPWAQSARSAGAMVESGRPPSDGRISTLTIRLNWCRGASRAPVKRSLAITVRRGPSRSTRPRLGAVAR